MKQKNRHNPLKDYTDFIYYLVNILLDFLKYNHYCISAYYITLGTNMTILYSKHSFIECFVCPINAK